MTYDVLLALRGWGEREFRLASPDFLSAVRHALFAERMAPELAAARAVQDTPFIGLSFAAYADLARKKTQAIDQIKILEPLLVPDGD